MRIYTVHDRPVPPGDDPDVVLVKEGFCWPALFVPALWLLFHRHWLGLILYLAVGALLGAAMAAAGLTAALQAVLAGGLNLMVATLANDGRRWALERQGYTFRAVVAGAGLDEAERRLFDSPWLAEYARRRPRDEAPAAPLFPHEHLGRAG